MSLQLFEIPLVDHPHSVIVLLLCHHHPHSVIVPLLCHHHPHSVIVPLLSSSPTLCHRPPALPSSPTLCHCPPALSSSPTLCHCPPDVIIIHTLSSSPCSFIIIRTLSSFPCSVCLALICHDELNKNYVVEILSRREFVVRDSVGYLVRQPVIWHSVTPPKVEHGPCVEEDGVRLVEQRAVVGHGTATLGAGSEGAVIRVLPGRVVEEGRPAEDTLH